MSKSDTLPVAVNGTNGQPQPLSARRFNGAPKKAQNEQESGLISVNLVLYAIARWWKLALPLGLVMAAGAVAAIYWLFPTQYRAYALIQIESTQPTLAFPQPENELFVRTQVELIKSSVVLSDVVGNREIADLPEIRQAAAPLDWITQRVSVANVNGSELFQIQFDTPVREHAAKIADAVLQSYMKRQENFVHQDIDKTIELLEHERDRRMEDMHRLQDKLKDVASLMPGYDPTVGISGTDLNLIVKSQGPLDALNSRLATEEVELEELEVKLQVAKERAASNEDSSTLAARILEQDATLRSLNLNVVAQQQALSKARNLGYGDDHPEVKQLTHELDTTQNLINERRATLQSTAADTVKSERQAQISALEQQQSERLSLKKSIETQIKAEQQKLTEAGDHSLDYQYARSELARAEEVFKLIADKVAQLKTEKRAPKRVKQLRNAADNDVLVQSSATAKAIPVGGFCFLLPFLLAIAWEKRTRRVTNSDQVSYISSLPLLAEISRIPLRQVNGRGLSQSGVRQALFEESIDQLRTTLITPDAYKDMKVFATVSAVSGEGKTSVSSQLAVCLARASNEPVLLVDFDMRAPNINEVFDVQLAPGLAEVLHRKCGLEEAIRTWRDNLHVLPAGVLDCNPNSLVSVHSVNELLKVLRPKYRYIILDSPPLLAASEGFAIAKAADAAIVCTMRDVSRGSQVKRVCERLEAVGVNTLGVILSGVPSYGYYYRYGRYRQQHYYGYPRSS